MATDLNHVVLIGRLTRDLASDERAFGYIGNGQARANVSIAVNRSRKNGDQWIDEANYFDVTIWGKQAENLRPYLTKGKQICFDGYLKQDRWEKDGQKFSKVSIVANNVQLLGGKSDGTGSNQSSGGFQPRNNFQGNSSMGMNSGNSVNSDNSGDFGSGYMGDGFSDPGMSFSEDIPF